MKLIKKVLGALMCLVFMVSATGCSSVTNGKRIVRVATMQSETHPEYLGLLKFKGKRQVICWIENHIKKIDNYIEN